MRILSQALSASLSGFYFSLMIYHPAIKKPFACVLEALQKYGGGIPAIAAVEGMAEVSSGQLSSRCLVLAAANYP